MKPGNLRKARCQIRRYTQDEAMLRLRSVGKRGVYGFGGVKKKGVLK